MPQTYTQYYHTLCCTVRPTIQLHPVPQTYTQYCHTFCFTVRPTFSCTLYHNPIHSTSTRSAVHLGPSFSYNLYHKPIHSTTTRSAVQLGPPFSYNLYQQTYTQCSHSPNSFITPPNSVCTKHFTLSETSAEPYTNTLILHCLTRADSTYRLPRMVCNEYPCPLHNIAVERRSDTCRLLKPKHSSSANNIYINIQCNVHILNKPQEM